MADIVLLNPGFDASFWGLEYVLPSLRKKAAMPTASLPLLAALIPCGHGVIIVEVIFVVDDNFASDKAAIRNLLPDIVAWQQRHGFPFIFVAEASLDLAIKLFTGSMLLTVRLADAAIPLGASAKRRFQPWIHFAGPYCVVPVLFFGSC